MLLEDPLFRERFEPACNAGACAPPGRRCGQAARTAPSHAHILFGPLSAPILRERVACVTPQLAAQPGLYCPAVDRTHTCGVRVVVARVQRAEPAVRVRRVASGERTGLTFFSGERAAFHRRSNILHVPGQGRRAHTVSTDVMRQALAMHPRAAPGGHVCASLSCAPLPPPAQSLSGGSKARAHGCARARKVARPSASAPVERFGTPHARPPGVRHRRARARARSAVKPWNLRCYLCETGRPPVFIFQLTGMTHELKC